MRSFDDMLEWYYNHYYYCDDYEEEPEDDDYEPDIEYEEDDEIDDSYQAELVRKYGIDYFKD